MGATSTGSHSEADSATLTQRYPAVTEAVELETEQSWTVGGANKGTLCSLTRREACDRLNESESTDCVSVSPRHEAKIVTAAGCTQVSSSVFMFYPRLLP